MDHVVTLTDDQERALVALVAQAQDAKLTVDILLKHMVDGALFTPVLKLLDTEAQKLAVVYVQTDVTTRAALQDIVSKAPVEFIGSPKLL